MKAKLMRRDWPLLQSQERTRRCSTTELVATLLGMLTGIGSGMVPNILLAEIPTVLRA